MTKSNLSEADRRETEAMPRQASERQRYCFPPGLFMYMTAASRSRIEAIYMRKYSTAGIMLPAPYLLMTN